MLMQLQLWLLLLTLMVMMTLSVLPRRLLLHFLLAFLLLGIIAPGGI
jgi:hypothetical protein